VCKAQEDQGGPCVLQYDCKPALACSLAAGKTCAQRLPQGAACTPGDQLSGDPCVTDQYCSKDSNTCVQRKLPPAPCSSDAECLGNVCGGGHCDGPSPSTAPAPQAGTDAVCAH
jgi:hypothetical protein